MSPAPVSCSSLLLLPPASVSCLLPHAPVSCSCLLLLSPAPTSCPPCLHTTAPHHSNLSSSLQPDLLLPLFTSSTLRLQTGKKAHSHLTEVDQKVDSHLAEVDQKVDSHLANMTFNCSHSKIRPTPVLVSALSLRLGLSSAIMEEHPSII